ncbi:MAG TPA: glycosyltransferase family 4 protein, partial [Chitinophagaceae bacterium]|nr:glycosyltransferase family 4 protein [Chitinophagaceae bacterium]
MKQSRILQIGLFPVNPEVPKGGVEASVYGLSRAQADRGDEVRVIDLPRKGIRDERTTYKGFGILRLRNPFPLEFFAVCRLPQVLREVRQFRPDVVHLHGSSLLGLVLLWCLRVMGRNAVITIHGLLTLETRKAYRRSGKKIYILQWLFYSVLEWLLIHSARRIIVDTEYVREWVAARKGKNALYVIPQGIEEVYFSLPDNGRPYQLLSVGAFSGRKGYEHAIRAVSLLVHEFPQLHYRIAGFSCDDAYFGKLKQQVADAGLEHKIELVPNPDKDTVRQYFSEADLFLLHS